MSRRRAVLGTATACILTLGTGCSLLESDDPEDDVQAFARALSKGDLSKVPVAQGTSGEASRWWHRTSEGMDDSTQDVEVRAVKADGDKATATLVHTWRLDGSSVEWTYDTTVTFVRRNDVWAVDLAPSAVAPRLEADERLR